jgi:hypothetical protein
MRQAQLIGGPLNGQNVTVASLDWYLIEVGNRIQFYLWDPVADAYRFDGAITGTRQTAMALFAVLSERPTPLHSEPTEHDERRQSPGWRV